MAGDLVVMEDDGCVFSLGVDLDIGAFTVSHPRSGPLSQLGQGSARHLILFIL